MFPWKSEILNVIPRKFLQGCFLALLCISFLFVGCSSLTTALPSRSIKYDARVLWVVLQNYVSKHPQMNHQALSRVTLTDLVKSGELSQSTVSGWQRQGLDVSVHPENFRAPGDNIVCQINDANSVVMATKSGEIKGN